jgi:hypothetical protein
MYMKVWLTPKATSAGTQQAADKLKLYGVEVQTSKESGGKYVSVYLDPIDPTVDMPRFQRGHVKMIAFSDRYHEGFRPEGVYTHKGARAVVKTIVRVETPYLGNNFDATSIERYQEISISAKSIKTLREIYTQIRQGKIAAVEVWSQGGRPGVELQERDMMSMM